MKLQEAHGEDVCLDTNIIIDVLDGIKSSKNIFNKIKEGKITPIISSLVECELYSSIKIEESKEYKKAIDLFLSLLKIIPVDRLIARKAGEFRRKYKVKTPDAIIAATAFYSKNKVIVTNNKSDFKKIVEIKVI